MHPRPVLAGSRRCAPSRSLLVSIVAVVGFCVGFAVAESARAAQAGGDLDRWVPSFAVYFDVVRQKATGAVSSGPVLGPPLDPYDTAQDALAPGNGCVFARTINHPGFPDNGTVVYTRSGALCPTARPSFIGIDASDTSSETSVAPLVGGSLELMTPRLLRDFLDPRLFVHGDTAVAFSFERNLAGKGRPGEFSVPVHAQGVTDLEELSIPGQGSRARWQLGKIVYSAGGGLAFTFTLFQRTFRLKPSFEWVQVDQDFIGVTRRAVKLQFPSGTSDISQFREISLSSVHTRTFDGIGPGLELEVDTARLGPIQTSLYAMGRGYYLLGNLDTTLTATNQYGETATWTFQPEQWMIRAGVGIRFRWLPEAD
jgi:hypothetical protein